MCPTHGRKRVHGKCILCACMHVCCLLYVVYVCKDVYVCGQGRSHHVWNGQVGYGPGVCVYMISHFLACTGMCMCMCDLHGRVNLELTRVRTPTPFKLEVRMSRC